jgi:hypothetical protein
MRIELTMFLFRLLKVYLCLRVIMCRFGSQHLTGILPIVLSELVSSTKRGRQGDIVLTIMSL